MKRTGLIFLIWIAGVHALLAQAEAPRDKPFFRAAEALTVTDLSVPMASIASGTVALDAVVDPAGMVQKVEVRRDIVSLTDSAVDSVGKWTFSPATLAGHPVSSRVPVAVTVRPALASVQSMPLPDLKPQTEQSIQAAFQPAEVLHAEFPLSAPSSLVFTSTVILNASLSDNGKVKEVKALQEVPDATPLAIAAVADWRFMAATLNGHPVESNIILVFVFRPPTAWMPQP